MMINGESSSAQHENRNYAEEDEESGPAGEENAGPITPQSRASRGMK